MATKTYDLKLSRDELEHLRALMGVTIVVSNSQVSDPVSKLMDAKQDSKIWNRLVKLCKAANVPIDEAPDHAISMSQMYSINIVKYNSEADDGNESEQDE